LGWSRVARRYSGRRCCFPLLGVLSCFSSPRRLGHPGVNARVTAPPGFSQPSAPVRLPAPRHPPHALSSLATPPHDPREGAWVGWRPPLTHSGLGVVQSARSTRSKPSLRRPARPHADPRTQTGGPAREGKP